MSLGGTDLNLLLPLKVLLEEGNVTRAARRLRVSQPTMSAMLARLRRRFDDDLLVRVGRDFEVTPFARDLLPEVQNAVHLLGRAFNVEDDFDPEISQRTFRLSMSDYAVAVMHGPLVRLVQAEAPGVRLVIGHPAPDTLPPDRVLGNSDAIIAPMGLGFRGLFHELWKDRMVVIADRSNRRLRGDRLTLDDLAELPHAVPSYGPGTLTPVDRVLEELNVDRRIAVRVFGFLPLLFVIEDTDMVASVPERLARIHTGAGKPLVLVDPPFGEVLLTEGYYFTEDKTSDSAYRWLFGRLHAAARELEPAGHYRRYSGGV